MSASFRLFAYGTLQIPDVLRAVTGRAFPSEPARLAGHARYRVNGRPYPGLCREPGSEAEGLLYCGLDEDALQRLDAFEDDFYRRQTLKVATLAGEIVAAEVYVVPPEQESILIRAPWSLEAFRETALEGFLRRLQTP
jgi:gamma-glutamylcyclotransferase (GGCT)/AIG2-like uncharacterized protein YtfP